MLTPISAATMSASVVLPRPGRAVEQHVVERLAAAARRLDADSQVLFDLVLAGKVGEGARPERAFVAEVFLGDLGSDDALGHHYSIT